MKTDFCLIFHGPAELNATDKGWFGIQGRDLPMQGGISGMAYLGGVFRRLCCRLQRMRKTPGLFASRYHTSRVTSYRV